MGSREEDIAESAAVIKSRIQRSRPQKGDINTRAQQQRTSGRAIAFYTMNFPKKLKSGGQSYKHDKGLVHTAMCQSPPMMRTSDRLFVHAAAEADS